ncbi:Lysophospholipase, alpha-beta hydrolase superfamily [Fontimonas thermophila]|uniref:Lysophospholipase, alpha-beta hydrolase superfamily n=1 Tax=Fontimonas thermophila TaxID=1076937 RepID=A0A1I2J835_9GAMM|nr:alpha/beta fold hydrolase [Fontimonas thermophila]SFF50962.1 Lysophospholipase, alpha-beta hydrolase superfamily [Fontimonas thermophila]
MKACLELRFDPGPSPADIAGLHVAVSVWLPDEPRAARTLLVCLPGGNMNRRYFDLRADDGDDSFSFAAQMTARGHVVAALDHLGLGDSSRPEDGWQLTPERLVAANAAVTAQLQARLREGRLAAGVPALPHLRSVGVGHSMGAMLTVLQQHAARSHVAVVLLGFSTRGLPEYLPPDLRTLADPRAVRPHLVEYARQMFGQPYPTIHRGGRSGNAELFGSRKADPRAVAALKAATDCVLPVPALMSMLPGNVAPEAAALDVPVFLGIGERDMVGPPHAVPAAFTGSGDVTLYLLPEAGHSHFLFPARTALFDRLSVWLAGLP